MSLSLWLEKTIRNMFESDSRTVNILELPPGLGKTKTAIDVAVEYASRGATVFFFTPTHAAALTALAYAINAIYDRVYTANLRVPYVVYYEGVSRQCPFFQYPKLLEYAAKHARSRLWITKEEYQRIRKVLGRNPSPSAVVRTFGWSFVCKKLCPLYRSKRTYEPYRIFIPRSFDQLTNKVLTGEARDYVARAAKCLGEMSKKKLVFKIAPYINFKNGTFYGVCSRILLNKPVARDRNGRRTVYTWLSGAIVIAPTSCFFHLYKLIYRIREISKKAPHIPTPIVVVDEYDFFLYRPAYSVLATTRWVGKEKKIAEAYLGHLVATASATGGVDEDVVLATATAVAFLREVVRICEDFFNGNVDQVVSSAVSMVGDIIAAPPPSYSGEPNPPFRTHVVKIASPEELNRRMLPLIEAVLREFGAHFARVEKVAKLGVGYYLKLWSSILPSIPRGVVEAAGEEDLTRYIAGLKRTYRNGEEVLEVVYVPVETPASVARYIYNIRLFAGPADDRGLRKFSVLYSARPTRVRALRYDPVKEKYVSAPYADFLLYMITYDAKWWWFNIPAKIILMSATGMPWDSDFYLTKIGLTNPFDENNFIVTYLRGYKFLQRKQYSDRIEYVFEPKSGPSPYKKKIVIVTCSYDIIDMYARHAEFDVAKLSFLPPKEGSDVYSMAWSLSSYVHAAATFVRYTEEALPKLGNYHGGVLAIVQRKDAALFYTYALADYLRKTYSEVRIQWCGETDCYDMYDAFMPAEAAYFLLRMKSKKAPSREVRVFVTWFRSRMARGVDLPADTAVLFVLCVGTPFKPPGSIDVYEDRPMYTWEIYDKSLRLEIVRRVWSPMASPEPNPILVSVGYMPYEVAEAINEFQQIVGRACRQAVRLGKYVVRIVIHYKLFNKVLLYSQLWFKEIMFMRGKKACEEAVMRGKLKEMMRQQAKAQQQQNQQPQKTGPPQDRQPGQEAQRDKLQ